MAISGSEKNNPGEAAEEDRRYVTILNKVVKEDFNWGGDIWELRGHITS